MKPILPILLAGSICLPVASALPRQNQGTKELLALAASDRPAFARALAGGATNDFARTERVVHWLARNFAWTATDYQTRTVDQILARRGGNCYELSVVTNALLDDLRVTRREVREINLQVESEERQRDAEAKVREIGNRGSVFGRHHNDHVWLEVEGAESDGDEAGDPWYPADPSMGVVGLSAWIEARAGFGDRTTLDPASNDMIVPMAIVVVNEDGSYGENRTQHYLVDALDAHYRGRLHRLRAWSEWVSAVEGVDDLCIEALRGETNLLGHQDAIERVSRAYDRLRAEFLEEN
jgi:Transglutaminase-like superfamily